MSSETKEELYNVGGAKQARRKNGHKTTCGCHICDNILNKAKRGDYKPKAASGKVNGHKVECCCPICKNMMAKKGKRGGNKSDTNNQLDEQIGGRRTRKHRYAASGRNSNGHKMSCPCPICKNMRASKMSRRNNARSKKRR